MKKKLKKDIPVKCLSVFLLFFTTFCFITYFPCKIYNFKNPGKFEGNSLFNPYKDSVTIWRKCNFHAHAIAWDGITKGKQKAADILSLYKRAGYDYASISNYEKVASEDDRPGSICVYEHGCNVRKVHQLVLMPKHVCYQDFPLFQFLSAKQFVINHLAENGKAIILAHPLIQNGYSDEDLQRLTGYNLMEVLNHSVNSSKKWDVALSSGKPVWIVGDDDTHDISDTTQTLTNWTMVSCCAKSKDSLIEDLRNGNAYAVSGKKGFTDNVLKSVSVHGMKVNIELQNIADSIVLIGQNGIIKNVIRHAYTAAYTFLDNDTYLRAAVYNKQSTMFLNPIMRYNGTIIPQNVLTATNNVFATMFYRSLLFISWLTISIFLIYKAFGVLKRPGIKSYQDNKPRSFSI